MSLYGDRSAGRNHTSTAGMIPVLKLRQPRQCSEKICAPIRFIVQSQKKKKEYITLGASYRAHLGGPPTVQYGHSYSMLNPLPPSHKHSVLIHVLYV